MKTTTTRAVALAGALAIILGATACSKSETPATGASATTPAASATSTTTTPAADTAKAGDILDKAKTNALAAKSAAFVGQVDQNGTTLKIDFKGSNDGKTADISIVMGSDGKVRLVSVPAGIYMQADMTFWKKQGAPAAVQKAGDKFIQAPASAASMTDGLSLKSFLNKAFSAVTTDQLSDKVGEDTIGGVDCWVLTDKKGKAEGALYVSKDKNEIVRFTGSTKSPGQLDFSRWNEDLGITAPEASQILKIS